MSEDRIDELEKRLAKVEGEVGAIQNTILKKLTEAMQLIQRHQKMRDARVNDQLRKIVQELTTIREKLASPPVMH